MKCENEFDTIFEQFCYRMKNCIRLSRAHGMSDTEILDQILYILDGEHESNKKD